VLSVVGRFADRVVEVEINLVEETKFEFFLDVVGGTVLDIFV
jgi:hypothetical protein